MFSIVDVDDSKERANDSHEKKVKRSKKAVAKLKEPKKRTFVEVKELRMLAKTNMSKKEAEKHYEERYPNLTVTIK